MDTTLLDSCYNLSEASNTLLKLDGEGVPICLLYFNEAIWDKDEELKDEAEEESEPEWPYICLSVCEYYAHSWHQDCDQENVLH